MPFVANPKAPAEKKSLLDRFRTRLESHKNIHLILVIDSCKSRQLVDDLRECGEDKKLLKLLTEKKSSISIQSSSAAWQKASGGVFTPWYLETVFTSAMQKIFPTEVQTGNAPENDASSTPFRTNSGLVLPYQHARYHTLGDLPKGLEAFLTDALIPVHLDLGALGYQGKNTKQKSGSNPVKAIQKAKQAALAAQYEVHDVKLGRNSTGMEIFAFVTSTVNPSGFDLHMHVKKKSAGEVIYDSHDKKPSQHVPVHQLNAPGKWIWLNPPRHGAFEALKRKISDLTDVEERDGTFLLRSEQYLSDDILPDDSLHNPREVNGGLFVRRPGGDYVADVVPRPGGITDTRSAETPWVDTLWQKSREFFEKVQKDFPKRVVFLTANGKSQRRHLETLKWDNDKDWAMEGSLLGMFRNKAEHPVHLRLCITTVAKPLTVHVAKAAKAFREAHGVFDLRATCPASYCHKFVACLHHHLGTSLIHPSTEAVAAHKAFEDKFWATVHDYADVLLRHWDASQATERGDASGKSYHLGQEKVADESNDGVSCPGTSGHCECKCTQEDMETIIETIGYLLNYKFIEAPLD
ncbi:hypothetical protein HKX48_006616 [Thoreauomyces humboldtii]|nr:hypothetical protein HKX48_006616 [Thoreauomyces humboldtii]